MIYQLDYNPDGKKNQEEYVQMFEDCGWEYLKDFAVRAAGEAPMAVIGPASPGIGKINDIYRKVIYLKSEDERILMAVKDRMEKYIEINRGFQSLKIQFDMNP